MFRSERFKVCRSGRYPYRIAIDLEVIDKVSLKVELKNFDNSLIFSLFNYQRGHLRDWR